MRPAGSRVGLWVVVLAGILGAAMLVASFALPGRGGAPPTAPVPRRTSTTLAASSTTGAPATTTTSLPGGPRGAVPAPDVALPPAPGPERSPPASIAANCRSEVSASLDAWLASLPASSTAALAPGGCYLINGGLLLDQPQGLTIDGRGARLVERTPGGMGRRALRVIGGKDLTIENLTIQGPDSAHVYDAKRAFQGAIELDGTQTALIQRVVVHDVYGDGVTVDPLRGGADHNSGTILRPTTDVTIRGCTVDGAGRQGVALVSVTRALLVDNRLSNVALDTFDVESDQPTEGARQVWIEHNVAGAGNRGLFFSDAGRSADSTGGVYVVANAMSGAQAGEAVLIASPRGSTRGPFVFSGNQLWAGSSVYVAALQIEGGDGVTIERNTVRFLDAGTGGIHEAALHVGRSTGVTVSGNVFVGAGSLGQAGSAVLVGNIFRR